MFCEKCGNKLEKNNCQKCGFQKFSNPVPVGVGIIPVYCQDHKIRLLGIQRGTSPKKGEIVLPGGFMEIESIHEAVQREVWEETRVRIEFKHGSQDFPFALSSIPDPNRVLIFVESIFIKEEDIDFTFKNEETERIVLISEDTPIGFELHKIAIDRYFEKRKKSSGLDKLYVKKD